MIEIEDEDAVRRIVLNRPDKANALTMAMLGDLTRGIASAASAGASIVVLSGAGDRTFCSGADLSDLTPSTRHEQYVLLQDLVAALSTCAVPVITLVHGRTLGAGCAIAALSDIVIARDDTVLGFPEMRFGMYPVLVHAILVEMLPRQLVYQICVSGRNLTAQSALGLGLVTEVVSSDDFAQSAAVRLSFYLHRIYALRIGRRLRQGWATETLPTRVAEAEAILDDNLNDPGAKRLLDDWLASMSRRGRSDA